MARKFRLLRLVPALPFALAWQCSWNGPPKPVPGTPQGWTDGQRMAWYTATQGSRLIPKAWLKALEQPVATAPFLDPAYVASFRYLSMPPGNWVGPNPSCPLDPALPLGFPVDCQSDNDLKTTHLRWKAAQSDSEPWVGLNCSACHTNALSYRGNTVLVDGAPTLADFQSFTEAMQQALKNTLADSAKFTRFAAAVLGATPAAGDADKLKGAMAQLIAWNDNLERLNATPGYRYGFGRLDAIGHIFNKVALETMPDNGAQQTANPSDAPVSYPFLWNVPQLDRVEWNGIAPNTAIGSDPDNKFNYGGLGRNTGEVVGVFGDVILAPNPGLGGYKSSINVTSLNEMENQLGALLPPAWPTTFPKIDTSLAQTGATLFNDRCSGCHTVPAAREDVSTQYITKLQRAFSSNPTKDDPVNTDMWMACNTVMDRAKSGVLKGNKIDYFSTPVFGDESDNFSLVQNTVIGSLLGQKFALAAGAAQNLLGFAQGLPQPTPQLAELVPVSAKEKRRAACLAVTDSVAAKIVYKGRPLQGIWATAPYMHNGSMPTLYDVLLPPAQRPATFYMGTREFDPVHVGFVTTPSSDNNFKFETHNADGTPMDGNSNAGHNYGNAGFSDADRMALIEYMKTL